MYATAGCSLQSRSAKSYLYHVTAVAFLWCICVFGLRRCDDALSLALERSSRGCSVQRASWQLEDGKFCVVFVVKSWPIKFSPPASLRAVVGLKFEPGCCLCLVILAAIALLLARLWRFRKLHISHEAALRSDEYVICSFYPFVAPRVRRRWVTCAFFLFRGLFFNLNLFFFLDRGSFL